MWIMCLLLCPFPVLLQVKRFQTEVAAACCNTGMQEWGGGDRLNFAS